MEEFIVIVLAVVLVGLCIKGIMQTFQRSPLAAILCLVFLFPIYIIWVIIEIFSSPPNKIVYIVTTVEKE